MKKIISMVLLLFILVSCSGYNGYQVLEDDNIYDLVINNQIDTYLLKNENDVNRLKEEVWFKSLNNDINNKISSYDDSYFKNKALALVFKASEHRGDRINVIYVVINEDVVEIELRIQTPAFADDALVGHVIFVEVMNSEDIKSIRVI